VVAQVRGSDDLAGAVDDVVRNRLAKDIAITVEVRLLVLDVLFVLAVSHAAIIASPGIINAYGRSFASQIEN
jgi:hypothetical protein